MFGFFNRNKKEKVARYLDANAQLVDVRTPSEFNKTNIPGSLNVPLQSIDSRMNEIDKKRPVLIYCALGGRSSIAASKLKANGYKVIDAGGIKSVAKHLNK